jgi:hypothetical protein
MAREHQWTKIVVVPVETTDDGDGNAVVFVDPDKQAIAENNAHIGCFACNVPIGQGWQTECEGSGGPGDIFEEPLEERT